MGGGERSRIRAQRLSANQTNTVQSALPPVRPPGLVPPTSHASKPRTQANTGMGNAMGGSGMGATSGSHMSLLREMFLGNEDRVDPSTISTDLLSARLFEVVRLGTRSRIEFCLPHV